MLKNNEKKSSHKYKSKTCQRSCLNSFIEGNCKMEKTGSKENPRNRFTKVIRNAGMNLLIEAKMAFTDRNQLHLYG